MQKHDEVIARWLSGSDCTDNPAGPLYLDSSTEHKMISQAGAAMFTTQKTTESCANGCICC